MKKFEVEYITYAGNYRTLEIEAESKDKALEEVFELEVNYSSDSIQKIISITEI